MDDHSGALASEYLYAIAQIPGLQNNGKQIYLTFNSNGTCGTSRTSSDEVTITSDIRPDVVYGLYIRGITDLNTNANEQSITWELVVK